MYILLFCGKSNSIRISHACPMHLMPGDHKQWFIFFPTGNDLISFFTAEEFSYWHLSKVLTSFWSSYAWKQLMVLIFPSRYLSINAPDSLVTISLLVMDLEKINLLKGCWIAHTISWQDGRPARKMGRKQQKLCGRNCSQDDVEEMHLFGCPSCATGVIVCLLQDSATVPTPESDRWQIQRA